MRRARTTFVLALVSTVAAGAALAATPTFLPATRVGDRLEFPAPDSIDWLALAPPGLTGFALDQPPPTLLARLLAAVSDFGYVKLPFEAKLPAEVELRRFYLVSASGIRSLRPELLAGTVRFQMHGERVVGRTVYGALAARLEEGPADPAGFVLAADRVLEFAVAPSSHDARELVPPEVAAGWETLPPRGRRFWTLEQQYAFRIGAEGPAYAFARWAADDECFELCCALRLSITEAADPPRPLASYDGGCDL